MKLGLGTQRFQVRVRLDREVIFEVGSQRPQCLHRRFDVLPSARRIPGGADGVGPGDLQEQLIALRGARLQFGQTLDGLLVSAATGLCQQ